MPSQTMLKYGGKFWPLIGIIINAIRIISCDVILCHHTHDKAVRVLQARRMPSSQWKHCWRSRAIQTTTSAP